MCGPTSCADPRCTWSEWHRKACEARTVMRWPKAKRADYYAEVKKKRGEQALAALVAEVNAQWAGQA